MSIGEGRRKGHCVSVVFPDTIASEEDLMCFPGSDSAPALECTDPGFGEVLSEI